MSVDTSDAHEVRLLQDKHHESELQRRRAEHELELKREEAEAQQQEAERLRGVAAQMEGHLQAVETEAAAARAGLEIAVEEREAEAAKAAGAAEAAEAAEREAAGWRTKVEEMEAELKKSHTCAQVSLQDEFSTTVRPFLLLLSSIRALWRPAWLSLRGWPSWSRTCGRATPRWRSSGGSTRRPRPG